MTLQNDFTSFDSFQKKYSSFLIASHENPDGDAIGSLLGLGLVLEQMGKKVIFYNVDGVTESLAFLPQSNRVTQKLPAAHEFDAAIILDVGNKLRVGKDFEALVNGKPIAVIDHHASTTRWADVTVLEVESSSTGELLWQLIRHNKYPMNADAGTGLYCGLLVDTGCFQHPNTRAVSFQMASDLVASGVRVNWVSDELFHRFPKQRIELWKRVVSTLEFSGRHDEVASVFITRNMFAETSASVDMTESFVNMILDVRSVNVAVLLREKSDGSVKLSLRSRSLDVLPIVQRYGGGGHRLACGANLPMGRQIVEWRGQVVAEVKEFLLKNSQV